GMVGGGPSPDTLGIAATVPSRRASATRSRVWQGLLAMLGIAGAAGAGFLGPRPLPAGTPRPAGTPAASGRPAAGPPAVAPAQRDVARATALAQDGDNLYLAGDRNLARSKYLEAFELNPTPALALKLGMLAHLRGAAGEAEARGFLARALRDAPGTPAASV